MAVQINTKDYNISIGPNKPVFIVAEIGKNFIQTEKEQSVETYLKNAKELVRLAKEAGADAVKFQTHNLSDEQQANVKVVGPHFSGDRYLWVTRNNKATPVEGFWKPLKKYCDEQGILFFSTPMSRGAAELLTETGVKLWKIASCDVLDYSLLDYVRKTDNPIIISSGMSTLEEVDKAVSYLKEKNKKVVLLHCVSKYPCPPEDLQLQTISFFKDRYDIPIGFSDHSIGIDSALAAVALGSTVVEKHFSISRDLWGSDHKVSMTPEELKALVVGIREIEKDPTKKEEYLKKDMVLAGMGKVSKTMQKGEVGFRDTFLKCLIAGQDIPAGKVITAGMLYSMRPRVSPALPSEKYEDVLDKKTKKAIKKYEPISEELLES